MTYRGTLKNGVIVFRKRPALPEGTEVRVEPLQRSHKSPRRPKRPSFRPVGTWDGPPGELDRLLAEVQHMRDADVELERSGENDSLSA